MQVPQHLSNNIKQAGVGAADISLDGPFAPYVTPVTNNTTLSTRVTLVGLKPVVTPNSSPDLCLANIKFSLSVKCNGSRPIDTASFSLWGKISTGVNNIMVNDDGETTLESYAGVLLLSKTNISTLDDKTEGSQYVFDVNLIL